MASSSEFDDLATIDGSGATLRVRVKTRARTSEVLAPRGNTLEVAVAALPVEGAANEELVRTLADHFGVPKRSVSVASGHRSRTKLVRFSMVPEGLRVFLAPAKTPTR